VKGRDRKPLLFGVALAEGAHIAQWQHQIVGELRDAGAQDVVYYAIPAPVRPDRRLLMRRAAYRVPALRRSNTTISWQRWVGQHGTELDFVLSFASGSAEAALDAGTRLGCWSFSPQLDPATDLLDHYVAGEPVLTVTLRRIGLTGGRQTTLHRGVFRCDDHSFSETLASVFKAVADWPVRALRMDAGDGSERSESPADAIHLNGKRSMRRGPVRMTLARTHWNLRRDVWNIGVASWPNLDAVRASVAVEPSWLPDPPRGHFLADPFPLVGGAHGATILAEDYDFATSTGRLVATQWDPSGAAAPAWTPTIRLRHHASYPYVVRTPEGTFCVPECLQSEEVSAWRLQEDNTWTKAGTLISGRRLVDPTVIRHKGRWWIFATDEDRGPDTNLYGWHAPSFFGPWRQHRLNPLKTDVRSTRPAGPWFFMGDRLVRPAQDCSRTYGGQIVLNEVLRLDESSFDERAIATVRIADGSPYPAGPHTLNFLAPDLVLVDGKRAEWVDLRLAIRHAPRRFVSLGRRMMRRRRPHGLC
jgi:hypothetical protein